MILKLLILFYVRWLSLFFFWWIQTQILKCHWDPSSYFFLYTVHNFRWPDYLQIIKLYFLWNDKTHISFRFEDTGHPTLPPAQSTASFKTTPDCLRACTLKFLLPRNSQNHWGIIKLYVFNTFPHTHDRSWEKYVNIKAAKRQHLFKTSKGVPKINTDDLGRDWCLLPSDTRYRQCWDTAHFRRTEWQSEDTTAMTIITIFMLIFCSFMFSLESHTSPFSCTRL